MRPFVRLLSENYMRNFLLLSLLPYGALLFFYDSFYNQNVLSTRRNANVFHTWSQSYHYNNMS